jgi:hypothetical protein
MQDDDATLSERIDAMSESDLHRLTGRLPGPLLVRIECALSAEHNLMSLIGEVRGALRLDLSMAATYVFAVRRLVKLTSPV